MAPDEEPKTYPHAAHIPVPIDIKHALSGKVCCCTANAHPLRVCIPSQ
jgi:hypothetical protein